MAKKIGPEDYDAVMFQFGEEYLAGVYYRPKEISSKRRIKAVLDALGPVPGEKIPDAGRGVGTFAFHSAERGACAFGIDYSCESVKMAARLTLRFAP